MTRLTKQDICRGMEAGISEWTMHSRVYLLGKTDDEAIVMGISHRRKPLKGALPRKELASRYGLPVSTFDKWLAKELSQGKPRKHALAAIRERARKRNSGHSA